LVSLTCPHSGQGTLFCVSKGPDGACEMLACHHGMLVSCGRIGYESHFFGRRQRGGRQRLVLEMTGCRECASARAPVDRARSGLRTRDAGPDRRESLHRTRARRFAGSRTGQRRRRWRRGGCMVQFRAVQRVHGRRVLLRSVCVFPSCAARPFRPPPGRRAALPHRSGRHGRAPAFQAYCDDA